MKDLIVNVFEENNDKQLNIVKASSCRGWSKISFCKIVKEA